MGITRRLSRTFQAFLEDTLADVEGLIDEFALQSGAEPSTAGLAWVRRRRDRLRRLLGRRSACPVPAAVDVQGHLDVRSSIAGGVVARPDRHGSGNARHPERLRQPL